MKTATPFKISNEKNKLNLSQEIQRLKKEKNAVILAHYYQEEAIQEVADYLGDSLYLAQQAAKVDQDIIVFAGVHFMAETAKIINPTKKVLLPDLKAGCSLADSCPPEDFAVFKAKHPNAIIVSYINCSAEVKTLSDLVCTPSNAKKIIESIEAKNKLESYVYQIKSSLNDENLKDKIDETENLFIEDDSDKPSKVVI